MTCWPSIKAKVSPPPCIIILSTHDIKCIHRPGPVDLWFTCRRRTLHATLGLGCFFVDMFAINKCEGQRALHHKFSAHTTSNASFVLLLQMIHLWTCATLGLEGFSPFVRSYCLKKYAYNIYAYSTDQALEIRAGIGKLLNFKRPKLRNLLMLFHKCC